MEPRGKKKRKTSLRFALTASASTSHTKTSPCSLATASSGSTGWNETALTLLPEGRKAEGRSRIVSLALDGREKLRSRGKRVKGKKSSLSSLAVSPQRLLLLLLLLVLFLLSFQLPATMTVEPSTPSRLVFPPLASKVRLFWFASLWFG